MGARRRTAVEAAVVKEVGIWVGSIVHMWAGGAMSGRVQWPNMLLMANLHLVGTGMGRSMSAPGCVVWSDKFSRGFPKTLTRGSRCVCAAPQLPVPPRSGLVHGRSWPVPVGVARVSVLRTDRIVLYSLSL